MALAIDGARDRRDASDRHADVTHWSRAIVGTERQQWTRGAQPTDRELVPASVDATDLAHGSEATNSLGRYWHISRALADVWPASQEFVCRVQIASKRDARDTDRAHEELGRFITAFPNRALFLDLETCGLAGSAIFLVGLIRVSAGQLRLEQLWARSHAEEAGVIGALREIADGCDMLITFNGKSFDWPQVRDRATLHTRMVDGVIKSLDHLDLLHHARRRYQKRFGDCKLQTLERYVCGRIRTGDLPGARIPAVYAEYVRTADSSLVRPILHHNALDLVTLLQLAITLVSDESKHASSANPDDH